jgi:3-hydroxyacyl-CoA dehydrogenase
MFFLKVIGMHYFSPVDKIELLEIIRSKQTSDETLSSAISLGLQQGKVVIVVNDKSGFYVTRLVIFASIEVFYLLQEGLPPNEIDQATKKFGFHVGLATLIDEFGIDIIAHSVFHLQNIFGERLANSSVLELIRIFIKNNLFGRKSRQGLYLYRDDGNKQVNPKLKELIANSLIQTKVV